MPVVSTHETHQFFLLTTHCLPVQSTQTEHELHRTLLSTHCLPVQSTHGMTYTVLCSLVTTHRVPVLSTHTWHTQFITLPIVCLFHLHTAWHTVIYSLPTAYLFCLHTAWHTQFLHCLPVLSTLSALRNKNTACFFNDLNSILDLYSTVCMACWCNDWWQLS